MSNPWDINWDRLEKEWQLQRDEFKRLSLDPTNKIPKVGDRVVFASGLVGHGFHWVREEAEVIEVGETSYKLRFRVEDSILGAEEIWVHPVLITDVLD